MRVLVSAGLAIVLVGSGAHAAMTVRGKLPGAEWVVNGITLGGAAVSATPDAKGKFRLRFDGTTGRGATLQLVGTSGAYFGPVVLKAAGGRAYSRLAGRSVNLKKLQVRDGYASARRVPGRAIDKSQWAVADATGKPVGAGRLGLVAATPALRTMQTAADETSGGDADQDGIPNPYDADDDGDLVLDSADRDSAQAGAVHTGYVLNFGDALNVNADGVTQEQIDAKLAGPNNFAIVFWFYRFEGPGFDGQTIQSAHVDCFGLPYCRVDDGTAIISGLSESSPDLPRNTPWIAYSPDGSGLPNLERIVRQNDPDHPSWAMGVQPRATTAQMTPGDAFNVTFVTDGGSVTVPSSLSGYFVTVPALASYDVGAGPQTVAYPVPSDAPGTSQGSPAQMTSESLTLTFWRPQRRAIAGAEDGDFIDMSHLHYGIQLFEDGQFFGCPEDYSALSDTLETGWTSDDTQAVALYPLTDSSADAAPDPARTLSFTVDLGACLDRHGVSKTGRTVNLTLTASSEPAQGGSDKATIGFVVRLP